MDYKVINNTSYNHDTPDHIISILEECRKNSVSVALDYGHPTGESWGETSDIIGYISRSTGKTKIPILVYNKRSTGGASILTNCIVKITTTKGKRVLYQHPNYKPYNE